jgi:hypothetical protein
MPSFRLRCYDNEDVRWIELLGAAAATPAQRVREEVAACFDESDWHGDLPRRYVLDLSQVCTVGTLTLEAILDAMPASREIGLIPPPVQGWFAAIGSRIDLSVAVYAGERHALLALGLESRGALVERPDENRRHIRVETALKARIWFDHPRGPRFGRALVANLSKTGAYLTKLDCEIGRDEFLHFAGGAAPLLLDLPISIERRSHLRSRVVRIDTDRGVPQFGVHFEEVDAEIERLIARYIAERCPDEGAERARPRLLMGFAAR